MNGINKRKYELDERREKLRAKDEQQYWAATLVQKIAKKNFQLKRFEIIML